MKRRISESIFYWICNLIVPCLAQGMFMCGCACQETGCIFSSYPAAPAPLQIPRLFPTNTSPSTHHPFSFPRQRMPCSIFSPHSIFSHRLLTPRPLCFAIVLLLLPAPAHSTTASTTPFQNLHPFIPNSPPLSLFLTCSYLLPSSPSQNSFHPRPHPHPRTKATTSLAAKRLFSSREKRKS